MTITRLETATSVVMTQKEKAATLRNLHHAAQPLIIGNAWDAASARLLELAGFLAIGTTSAGIAFSHGFPDGQKIPKGLMVESVAEICRTVSVPVTADMEAGYGNSPEDIERITEAVIQAGAVGMNVEDGTGNPATPLGEISLQVEKLKTIKKAAAGRGINLVLNARTDAYLYRGEAAKQFEETLRRSEAYLTAGADCIFIIGLLDRQTISDFVKRLKCPINVIVTTGSPTIKELQDLGVARVSFGSGPMRATMTLLQRIAAEILGEGTYSTLEGALSHNKFNELMSLTTAKLTDTSSGNKQRA